MSLERVGLPSSRLVFNEAERIGSWAQARIPNFIGWSGYYQAIGREVDGELDAAVVYTNASPTNVVASIVLERPLTRRFLHVVFWYPFGQLRVPRITALVEEKNERSLCLCKRLGFMVEGKLREAAVGGGDVIVMGILRTECRWFNESNHSRRH